MVPVQMVVIRMSCTYTLSSRAQRTVGRRTATRIRRPPMECATTSTAMPFEEKFTEM